MSTPRPRGNQQSSEARELLRAIDKSIPFSREFDNAYEANRIATRLYYYRRVGKIPANTQIRRTNNVVRIDWK